MTTKLFNFKKRRLSASKSRLTPDLFGMVGTYGNGGKMWINGMDGNGGKSGKFANRLIHRWLIKTRADESGTIRLTKVV